MNWDQASGMLDRVLSMGAVWLVARGYISASDAAQYIPLLIALAGAAWGWYRNRPIAQLQSAASVPGTTIVASPALAGASPQANIVSSGTSAVVSRV